MLFNLSEILVIVAVEALLLFVVLHLFFKNKSKNQLNVVHNLESEIETISEELSHVESLPHEDSIDITKTSFIGEQIKKVESLEAELIKQHKRVQDAKVIAQQASMARESFLENVNYEIYTPLNTIIRNTESLGKALNDKKLLGFAKKIYNSSRTLSQLFENIVKLSELKSNTFETLESAVDIRSLLENKIQKYRELANSKSLEFDLSVNDDIPAMLMLDENIIEEIADNLIHNAIKFTNSGYVKVRVISNGADRANNSINFSLIVEDSGVGIDKKDQERIFNIFEKLDEEDENSMGLGLSINKKMASSINATLELQSVVSRGSTFALFCNDVEIFLSNDANNTFDALVDFSDIRPDGASIMIIDEDQDVCDLIIQSFKGSAIEIFTFRDTRDAISVLKNKKFDMIFIDINMLSIDDSAVSKVIVHMSRAPVVTLTDVRLKYVTFDKDGVKPAGHLKKPISKFELFKISLDILDSKNVRILSDGTLKIK